MSTFEQFFHTELTPAINKLRADRIKLRKKTFISISLIILIGEAAIISYMIANNININLNPKIFGGLNFIILLLILIFYKIIYENIFSVRFKSDFRNEIVQKIVHHIDPSVNYIAKEYINPEAFLISDIFSMSNLTGGSDFISGEKDGATFKASQITYELNRITGRRSTEYLSGLFFMAPYEDPEDKNREKIISQRVQEISEIINTKISCSIRRDYIFILIHTGEYLFDPSLLHDLNIETCKKWTRILTILINFVPLVVTGTESIDTLYDEI